MYINPEVEKQKDVEPDLPPKIDIDELIIALELVYVPKAKFIPKPMSDEEFRKQFGYQY